MEVKELGHIVLYVRDVEVSRGFYGGVLGWKELTSVPGQMALFSSGRTHHELLLIQVGQDAAPIPPGRRVGLYHFGLKVGTTDEELRAAYQELVNAGANIVGSGDHGVTHSLYITDPDGNEIEVYIDVQPEVWREDPLAVMAPVRPLQLRSAQTTVTCDWGHPEAPFGAGVASTDVCVTPCASVARASITWVPFVAGHSQRHSRQVSIVSCVESSATCHGPLSTRTSTFEMPTCCAHAMPATTTVPACLRAPGTGVSIRDSVLIGPLLRPAARHPVRVVGRERRELHVHDPLAGGHVAVQAGHDHAHRKAVLDRQRLAVHGDREHRVAAVHERGDRGADRHAVGRPHHQLVRVRMDAGLLEQRLRQGADPPAFPMYGPPTGFDTQQSVMSRSTISRSTSCR